jgi:hypothetical protein
MSGYTYVLIPDYISALVERLQTDPNMTAVVSAERIVGRFIDSSSVTRNNWLSIVSIGGRDPFNAPPTHMYPHLEAHCFGTTGYESMRIWRTLKSVLEAPYNPTHGFTFQGCVIHDVRVAMPRTVIDISPNMAWDKRVSPIYLVVSEVPVIVQEVPGP